MSEFTDEQIAAEEDKALDAQIADHEESKREREYLEGLRPEDEREFYEPTTHHYTIDRKLWTDRKGNPRMSDYWQIRCSCGWRGTRITKPGREQSKERVAEWEHHVRNS